MQQEAGVKPFSKQWECPKCLERAHTRDYRSQELWNGSSYDDHGSLAIKCQGCGYTEAMQCADAHTECPDGCKHPKEPCVHICGELHNITGAKCDLVWKHPGPHMGNYVDGEGSYRGSWES